MKKISIIGGGGFGWAWALLLAWAGNEVIVWTRRDISGGIYPYEWLGLYPKPDNLQVRHFMMAPEVGSDDIVFIATPTAAIQDVIERFKGWRQSDLPGFVTLTKGLYGGMPPQVVIEQLLPGAKLAHVTGAAFSEQLVATIRHGLWMHMVAASKDEEFLNTLENVLYRAKIKTVKSRDPVSVQLGFAMRPVVSFMQGLATGYCETSHLRLVQHIVLARMEYEGFQIAYRLGADPDELGNSQVDPVLRGDYDLCRSEDSRNFKEGKKCATGRETDGSSEWGVVEAIHTIRHLYSTLLFSCGVDQAKARQRLQVDFPYFFGTHAFLFEGASLEECANSILARFKG